MIETSRARQALRPRPSAGSFGMLWLVLLTALGFAAGSTSDVAAQAGEEPVPIRSRITIGNDLGLTVFNDGFVGNNLSSRDPSLEYPLGSNIEHLVRAGLWVSGINVFGDTLTSTSAVAGRAGSRGFGSEFTPTSGIEELSILPNSRFFSPEARSEQDFRFSFADTVAFARDSEDHRPLDLEVDVETLLFSFEPFDAIVLMNVTVTNLHPTNPLFDVYVGYYTEFATGYKEPDNPDWDRGWFDQKDIGYFDSLHVSHEHHFLLDNGDAPTWAGLALLGTRPLPLEEMTVSFNWWNWDDETNRTGDAPIFDADRFEVLGNGEIRDTEGSEAPNNDPVGTLSVGPFPILEAGASVTTSWAWLGGQEDRVEGRDAEEDLIFNAGWAQTAFDLDLNIPLPPPSPSLLVQPDRDRLILRWDDLPERFIDPRSGAEDFQGYRIYVSQERLETGFRNILEADVVDSVFYNTGLEDLLDPVTIDGVDYKYRYDINGLRDGFKYWTAVTAFDTGDPEIASLESGISQNRTFAIPGSRSADATGEDVVVFPNPYNGDAEWDGSLGRDRYLWFGNLPARCAIRIYTLAGDLVDTIEFDQDTYAPLDVRGIYDPTDSRNPESDLPQLAGGMAAWDIVSRRDQGIASGLYIYSVEDHDSGDRQLGKFIILK